MANSVQKPPFGNGAQEDNDDLHERASCVSNCCCGCRLLPIDVIYNNARSRIVVGAMFILLASAVLYVVSQIILDLKEPSATITWVVAPPSEAYLAFPMEPLTVRIRDENGKGIKDVDVTAKLFPKQPFNFDANDGSGRQLRGRTANCVSYLMNPTLSMTPGDDARLCNPVGWQSGSPDEADFLVTGFRAKTDNDGIAVFNNLTLFFGVPVPYVVRVSHSLSNDKTGRNEKHVSSTTVMKSFVHSVSVTKAAPATVSQGTEFSVHATVVFHIKDNRNWLQNNESVLLQQFSLSRFSPKLRSPEQIEFFISRIVGTVIASPFADLLGSEPENTALFTGNTVKPRRVSIDYEPLTSIAASLSLPRHVITADFEFPALAFVATAFSRQFILFTIAGSSVIVPVESSESFQYQTPNLIPSPIIVTSRVTTVEIFEASNVTHQTLGEGTHSVTEDSSDVFRVREGAPFTIRFRTLDKEGNPVKGQRCFGVYGPLSVTRGGNVGLKRLSAAISTETNAQGIGEFSGCAFSSFGHVGRYFLRASTNEDRSSGNLSVSGSITLDVVSSLNITAVIPYLSQPPESEDARLTVRVGVPWPIRPVARVTKENGAGVSGKVADIKFAEGPGNVTLNFVSRPSDADGFLGFDEVTVQAVTSPGVYSFYLELDGVLCPNTFSLEILPSQSAGESCASFQIHLDPDLGGALQVIGSPLTAVQLLALDQRGSRSPPDSGVRVRIVNEYFTFVTRDGGYKTAQYTDWLSPDFDKEFPYNLSEYSVTALPHGSSSFRATPLTLAVECSSNISDNLRTREVTQFMIVVLPRLSTAFVVDDFQPTSNATYTATIAIHSVSGRSALLQDSQFPIAVSLSVVQQPRFMSDYFTALGSVPLFNQTEWLVSDTAAVPSFHFDIAIQPIHVSIAGHFVFKVVVDGLTLSQLLELEIVPRVAQLQLLQPINTLTSGFHVGVPFFQQPSVRVLDRDGLPIQGARVVAEFAVIEDDNDDGSGLDDEFAWPISQPDDFFRAGISELLPRDLPISSLSDANGEAGFSRLGFLGASPSSRYRVRYVATRLPEGTGGVTTVSVMDPGIQFPASDLNVTLIPLQAPAFAVPGVPASSSIFVAAYLSNGIPFHDGVAKLLLNGTLDMENQEFNDLLLFPPIGTFISAFAGVFNVTGLTFHSGTPPGEYKLQLVIPGGINVVLPSIRVLDTPAEMVLVHPPASRVYVGQSVPVTLSVASSDGAPFPGVIVDVSLVAVNAATGSPIPEEECIRDSCGVLDFTTVRTTTNSSGVAIFAIVLKAGESGTYKFTFSITGSAASMIERAAGKVRSGLPVGSTALLSSQYGALESTEMGGVASESASVFLTGAIDEDAKSFVSQEVGSLLHGDAPLTALATSLVFRALSAETAITVETEVFHVQNDVANITIVVQPTLGTDQDIVIEAKDTLGGYLFEGQPVVRVIDAAGRPLARRTVHVSLVPDTRDLGWDPITLTNESGFLEFKELRMGKGDGGTFHLIFSVDGVSSVPTSSFEIEAVELSTDTLLYGVTAGAICLLLPVFFSTQPFSSGNWIFISLAMLIVVVVQVLLFIQEQFVVASSVYLSVQLQLVNTSFGILIFSMLIIALIWLCESKTKPITERFLDDQSRPKQFYRYTKWFISVRRPFRSQDEWEDEKRKEAADSLSSRCAGAWAECCAADDEKKKPRQLKLKGDGGVGYDLWQKHFVPPEIPLPDGVTYPTQFPIKIVIAACICFVLLTFVLTINLWTIEILSAKLKTFVLHFPKPPEGLSDAERTQFNAELQSGLIFGLNLLAEAIPALSSIGHFEETIRQIDFLYGWETLYSMAEDFQVAIHRSAVSATFVACVVIVLTWIFLLINTKTLMKKARRGGLRQLRENAQLAEADHYIGLQCGHFFIGFFLVYGVLFLVLMVFSSSFLVSQIFKTVRTALLASMGSILLTLLLDTLLVRNILTSGLIIRYLHPYAWWTLWAIILSLINGILQTVVRLIQAFFSIVLLFPRLDLDIFPDKLLFLDMGYRAYYAMLLADEEYNNPFFVTCAAALAAESMLRWHARENNDNLDALPHTIQDVEAIAHHRIQLPQMRTLALLHLQEALAMDPSSYRLDFDKVIEMCDDSAKTLHHRRIASRWRLGALLALNPSLRKLRRIDERFEDPRSRRPSEATGAMKSNFPTEAWQVEVTDV